MKLNIIYNEDCRTGLVGLPDQSVNCCVTSPPYYGLRDYNHPDQIGIEKTPEEYIESMVAAFREVKRVLRNDGTLWLNIGDSYANGAKDYLKPKDLIGIPWMLAFALRADGWYLRQDIIWNKPNPMPESVTDRCTKSHEYIFLLAKSQKYYYDQDAIRVPIADASVARILQNVEEQNGTGRAVGKTNGKIKAVVKGYNHRGTGDKKLTGHSGYFDKDGNLIGDGMANKKSVWTVTTKPFKEAHFATFPEELIVDCIKAGCPEDGIVLDPFMGAGTTALVAGKLNRKFIGFELNGKYLDIANKRLKSQLGLFL